jgi:hypothetical protein
VRTLIPLLLILWGMATPVHAWGPMAHCQANSTSWHKLMAGYGGPARAGELFIESAPMPDMISNYNIWESKKNIARKAFRRPEKKSNLFDYAHNLFSSNNGRMLDVGGDDNSSGVPLFGLHMCRLADADKSGERELYRWYARGWVAHQLADSTMHGIYGIAERFEFLPPGMIGSLTSLVQFVGRHGCLEMAVDAINYDAGVARTRLRGGKHFFEAPIIPWLIHEASLEMLRGLPPAERKKFKTITGRRLIDNLRGSYAKSINGRIAGVLPGARMAAQMIRQSPQYAEIKAFYTGQPLKTYFNYYHGQIPQKALYSHLPAQLKRDLAASGIAPSEISNDIYLSRYDYRLPFQKSLRKIEAFLRGKDKLSASIRPSQASGSAPQAAELYTDFITDFTARALRNGAMQVTASVSSGSDLPVYAFEAGIADTKAACKALKETLNKWMGEDKPAANGALEAAAALSSKEVLQARRYFALVMDGVLFHPDWTYAAVLERADKDLEAQAQGSITLFGPVSSEGAPLLHFSGMLRPDPFRPLQAFIDGKRCRPVMIAATGDIAIIPSLSLSAGKHELDITFCSEAGNIISKHFNFVAKAGPEDNGIRVMPVKGRNSRIINSFTSSLSLYNIQSGYEIPMQADVINDDKCIPYVLRNDKKRALSGSETVRPGESFILTGDLPDYIVLIQETDEDYRELPALIIVLCVVLFIIIFVCRRRRRHR